MADAHVVVWLRLCFQPVSRHAWCAVGRHVLGAFGRQVGGYPVFGCLLSSGWWLPCVLGRLWLSGLWISYVWGRGTFGCRVDGTSVVLTLCLSVFF